MIYYLAFQLDGTFLDDRSYLVVFVSPELSSIFGICQAFDHCVNGTDKWRRTLEVLPSWRKSPTPVPDSPSSTDTDRWDRTKYWRISELEGARGEGMDSPIRGNSDTGSLWITHAKDRNAASTQTGRDRVCRLIKWMMMVCQHSVHPAIPLGLVLPSSIELLEDSPFRKRL